MNSFRKIFAAGVMMTTILSLCVVSAPANAAASAGDLIKINGSSSVYYLGANGKRYVFPNEATYFSWYKDFSGVVTVSQSEIEGYPLAANIVIRPGTKLVKSPSISTVYAVEPNGVLRSIVSEANAKALWGDNWNKKVVDVIDAFFTNYTVGAPLTAGVYPAGQLFKTAGSPDVYVQGTDGKARKFASEAAFLANNYNWDNIQTAATTFVMPSTGSAVAGREDGIADVSQGGGAGSGVVAGTGMTVALASDTPAASTIPLNAPSDFLKFNVTAANDGAVTINSIKFTATGLGDHTQVQGVTVYVNGARVGNAKNIDSNNEANMNFSSGIVIPAGQTKSIVVRASLADEKGHILGIAKASDIVATGATVSGSFPITGSVMTGSNVAVGNIAVSTGNSLTDPKLGDKAFTIASVSMENSNNKEDINVYSITLKRSAGTAADDDFENIGLYVSGAKVASSMGLKDKFVTFTFDTPYLLEKGKTKKFDVKADIVDGVGKTVTISLDSTSDITAVGKVYGSYATISGSYAGSSLSINSGDVALAKENASIDKVRKDTTNVALGTVKITPNTGKNVELSTFAATITFTGTGSSSIENVEIMDKATGNVYDLSEVHGTSVKYRNTAVDMTLTSGITKEFVVRADVKASAVSGDSYAVSVAASDLTVKDLDNNTITDKTPSSLSFNVVTVQAPLLTVSTNALSSALSAVVGTSNVQVLSLNFKANSTDALKVTDLTVTEETSDTMSTGVISQYRLYKDGIATPIKALSGSKVSADAVTFNDLDINVPKGEEVKYYVTVDFVNDNGLNGTTSKWGLTSVTAEDVTEGESVSTSGFTSGMDSGRTVTLVGAGSLVVEMDNSNTDTQKDRYEIAGNATGLLAAIKVRGANESINIEDLRIAVLNASAASSTNANTIFSKLQIVDSDKTTVLKEISNVTAETLVEDINVVIPSTGSKTVYLKGVLNPIGKDLVGVNNEAVTFRVDEIVAKGVDSNQALTASSTSLSSKACDSGDICYVSSGASAGNSTGSSKETGILSSRISSVELVSNGGGCAVSSALSSGANAVAVLKVTTDNTANTLANGDEIKTILNRVRVDASVVASSSTWSIEKCGGVDGTVNATTTITDNGSATVAFDVSGWTNDGRLSKQTTAYYVVKATLTNVSATAGGTSIQVDLNNLDAVSAAANFFWQDSSDAGLKSPLRLSTNKVTGSKITN
jgi:hypothetical protein